MTAERCGAEAILGRIEADMQRFLDMEDDRNGRVHSLFAGLYVQTTRHWLAELAESEAPEFAYAVIPRFYALYEEGVLRHLETPVRQVPRQWRMYHRLARRLTMRSPISVHLALISLGARAHIRHDLGIAIAQVLREVGAGRLTIPVVDREQFVGSLSARAFLKAALDYVDWHRQRQSGWRWGVLGGYGRGLIVLRRIWVPVMEGWRRRAYDDGEALVAETPEARARVETFRPAEP
ncbi:MAG: DUF5995 family protein [Roseovarius indicus]